MTTPALARCVDVMRRCDPAYCASHGVKQTTDEEFDRALADAEDALEAMAPTFRLEDA